MMLAFFWWKEWGFDGVFYMMAIIDLVIFLGALSGLNCITIQEHIDVGVVKDMEFIPQHTKTIYVYNAATKTSIPQITIVPDKWYVDVEYNSSINNVEINEGQTDKIITGSRVSIRVGKSLILRDIRVIEVII